MLSSPLESTQRSLFFLRHNDDWKPVRAWLEANLSNFTERLESERDEIAIRRLQGSCQVLRSLLTTQDEAPTSYHS